MSNYALVELGNKNLSDEERKATKFRAKLFGLIYEDILAIWFTRCRYYTVIQKDVRGGIYKNKRVPIDFILKKDGKVYAVEAKCWPAYLDGVLKKLTSEEKLLKKIENQFSTPFLNKDFVSEYMFNKTNITGKILVWWDIEDSSLEEIKDKWGIDEIISLKKDVLPSAIKLPEVQNLLKNYKKWSDELFEDLGVVK
jgi:hypothetical protein